MELAGPNHPYPACHAGGQILREARLGLGSGDRFGVARGDSRLFEERCAWPDQLANCRESTVSSAVPPLPDATRILHGREGVNGSSPLEGFTKSLQGCRYALGGRRSALRSACLGSAYMDAQLWSMASGRSWWWQGSLL
jgi:hypothetical protein